MSQMCSQCALGDCPDKMCVTHTIKICVDCKMAPYTNQITFANKLPGLKNEIVSYKMIISTRKPLLYEYLK